MSLIEKKPQNQEKQQNAHTRSVPEEWDLPDIDDKCIGSSPDGDTPDMSVTAISGASCETFQLAGQRIGQARTFLNPILNVDADAVVLVNGNEVDENYVLQRRDSLEFVKKAGEKGTIFYNSGSR